MKLRGDDNLQKIVLYTTNCPKCKILKEKLDAKQIQYEICDDVDKMLDKGFMQAPMLEVDGTSMNFAEAVKWLKGDGIN